MSDNNPRADAKLKRLEDSLKDEILRRCLAPGMTQAAVLGWLDSECGVSCSASVLSEFLSWWPARKRAMAREAAALAWMEQAREDHPDWTEEKLFAEGQRKFAIQAIAEDDPKAWAVTTMARDSRDKLKLEETKSQQRAELIRLKREELEVKRHLADLAERRVVLLESKLKAVNDAVQKAKAPGGLTPEALKQIEEAAKIL
jgi:hypothetical protein